MSYTFHLLTTQTLLPGTYGLTVTASQAGYTPLTITLPITVQPAQTTQDTMRTLFELLTVIWRDGQARKSLTAQDCRETIISLALQTADYSRLPTSPVGLATGRVFVDGQILRVNLPGTGFTASPPGAAALFANATGSLFANPRHAVQHATALFAGGGTIIANARQAVQHATATFNGSGTASPNGAVTITNTVFLDHFTSLSMDNLWASPQTTGTWMPTRDYAPDNTQGWVENEAYMVNPFNPNTPDLDLYQVSGSNLLLSIKQTPSAQLSYVSNKSYVTGQIISHFSRVHGYFEARAKMSVATPGLNQAIWLYITAPGYYQEIDIVEFVTGNGWTDAQQSVHNLADGSNYGVDHFLDQGFDGSQWHTYGADWQSDFITLYIDRVQTGQVATPPGYTQDMHIWVSMQSGAADWSGPITNPGALPTAMTVDYVAVWATKPF